MAGAGGSKKDPPYFLAARCSSSSISAADFGVGLVAEHHPAVHEKRRRAGDARVGGISHVLLDRVSLAAGVEAGV